MGQIFTDKIGNNNKLLDFASVQVNQDAESGNELTRKSQTEAIAATAIQAQIVGASAQALSTNTYSAEFIQANLDAKQPNISVDSQYFSFVNNTLGLKDLGIVSPYKDTTHATMAEFITAATFNGNNTITVDGNVLDKMTMIFLQGATNPVEKAFVYLGTNHGSSADFVTFSVDYNEGTIRSFFSPTGIGLNYTVGTGQFSLAFGTGASDIGAQTVPVDSNQFNAVTGNTVLDLLKNLETFMMEIDSAAAGGQATANTRMNTVLGVTGNNMTTFTQGLLSDNKSVKELLQELEVLAKSAITDNGAIRAENSTESARVDAAILAERTRAQSAEATLTSNLSSEQTSRATADSTLQANILNEAITRDSADTALSNRLDIVEGTGAGSIAKAQADAALYTDAREQMVMAHVNANAADLAMLNNANIELKATVGADGLFDAVEVDSRNNQPFINVSMEAGEVVVFSEAVTLLGVDFKTNDKVMAKHDISAGNMSMTDLVYTRSDDSDITKGNLGSSTIELNASEKLDLKADSIGRTQLGADIEADIDDKVSLTGHGQKIMGNALVIEQEDSNLDASYGLYLKHTQLGNGALTGTSRALLVEHHVQSNGSGNPVAPNYAHNTITSHYHGSCSDMSMVLSGTYNEANAKAGTAINAIGSYSVSLDDQLGVNIGSFSMAENAAISNIAHLGYASTDGAGADRGVVGAITSQALATYNATRTADPFPYSEIALVADAKYAPAGSKAMYAYGDCVFEGGHVTVPNATTDTDALNLATVKGKQDIVTFDLSSGSAIITTALDLSKVPPIGSGDLEHGVSGVSVTAVKDVANSTITFTATGTNVNLLSSVTVYLSEFWVNARNA